MNFKKCAVVFVILIMTLSCVQGIFVSQSFAEPKKPVVVPGKTFLPLRVLARPFSNIYKEANDKSPIVEENVATFQAYYVYTRPEVKVTATTNEGWYEVGEDNKGNIKGWMKAEDVMEWKQSMSLSYEHPTGRKPVLMFDKVDPLRDMVKATAAERVKKAEEFYKQVESKSLPADSPIVSVEPKDAIDMKEQFYLLPILEHSVIEIEGREGRLLKLAAATKSERGEDTVKKGDAGSGSAGVGSAKPQASSESAAPATNPDAVKANAESVTANPDAVKPNADAISSNPEAAKVNPESKPSNPDAVKSNAASAKSDIAADKPAAVSDKPEAEQFKKLELDIVYVADMTASMQSYIDATLKAIEDITRKLTQNPEAGFSVRFGLWGYRDSMEIPGIEFVTKNFTPELQKAGDFVNTLAGVKVAQVGSANYQEDVFSGVDKGMRETKWSDRAMHIVILLGDAPSHEPGDKWNASKQSAETLRTFADDNGYSLFSIHIKDPEAVDFHEAAESQFKVLSKNKGVNDSSYYSVQSDKPEQFEGASKDIANDLVAMIADAKAGNLTLASMEAKLADPKLSDVKKKITKMGYAALVEWLGREKGVKAPRDVIAWVTDKDLIDPAVPSLDVRVLINKKQIDSLKTVLQEIMTAGRRGIIAGEKFFDALQAVPSVASRSGDQIRNAKSLAETGLVPEFMQDLPYQSKIMSMSNDLWASWSLDQQEEFLNEVDAKIQLYVAIHDEPKGWIPLNKGDDPDEHVYPLSLTALP